MEKPREIIIKKSKTKKSNTLNKKGITEQKHLDTTEDEADCKCIKIIGHLESVKWQDHRDYYYKQGQLALDDWTRNPFIWLRYIEKSDGILTEDDALLSKETEYWEIDEVQRYFTGDKHCQQVLFVYPYPYPRMSAPLGNHLWRANVALKLQSNVYQRELYSTMELTLQLMPAASLRGFRKISHGDVLPGLKRSEAMIAYRIAEEKMIDSVLAPAVNHNYFATRNFESVISFKEVFISMKMVMAQVQLDRLVVPDCLIKLDQIDYFKRKTFFRQLHHILSFQDRLQLVSFENLSSKRIEGVSLLQHLACFNAQTLKYLFLWRFVLPNENPLLINYSYITGSGQYISRPNTRNTFLRSLGELRNLRLLALEYAHIADGTGAALLSLLPVIKRTHFRLQLICREDQIPGRADAALGVGGYDIPDPAWRRVAIACPDIYLLFAFFRIRDYDNVRRFLTPSLPLREVHLQLGIDMKMRQRQDSDISCFIRHIAYRYANTLITLSIHQWRFAVFPLRRIFELMPKLVRLFYVGKVEDEVELKRLFRMIACGVCKNLKQIKLQIQDDAKKMDYWRDVVGSVTEEFSDIMQMYDIKFCLSIYKT